MDGESKEAFMQKERLRQRNRYVPVADRTRREQRQIRRGWRKNQKTLRMSRKAFTETQTVDSPDQTCLLQSITEHDNFLGKWCVVSDDGAPYPGNIVDFDDDAVEVRPKSHLARRP